MKDVKMPTSRSYHDYLISALKNPERAAGNHEWSMFRPEKFAPIIFDFIDELEKLM